MVDIPPIWRPGRLRSPAARAAGEALIERWNGSAWSITA
jgi:hypothetical protein